MYVINSNSEVTQSASKMCIAYRLDEKARKFLSIYSAINNWNYHHKRYNTKIRSVKLEKCINSIKLQKNYLLTVHMKQCHTTLSCNGLFQGRAGCLYMPLPQIM